MRWRKLRPDELDHELIWLSITCAAFGLGVVWLALRLPMPGCPFHMVTGLPCVGCGTTRALRLLLKMDFHGAVAMNPLAAVIGCAVAVFNAYAATVLILRLPRLRPESPSRAAAIALRVSAITVLAANWAWLI